MNIEITRLPNGLTVATDPQRTVESAALGLWFDVGTRHEDPAENGVAHLLEHMLFKGTKRRSAFDISAEIEAVGTQCSSKPSISVDLTNLTTTKSFNVTVRKLAQIVRFQDKLSTSFVNLNVKKYFIC